MLESLRLVTWAVPIAVAVSFGACGSSDHPPPFAGAAGRPAAPSDGGFDVQPADGEPAICGEEFIPAIANPPNLYFVLDRSGSMNEPFGDTGVSKYETARELLGDVLRAIGHRVRYGAAVFPALASGGGCVPGLQVFPTTAGDPASFAKNGQNGPILSDLLARLGYADLEGGTPTAATLAALRETLVALGERTHVVLATDGAPNCNDEASCTAAGCMLNIEGASVGDVPCAGDYNCCDPDVTGAQANRWCVDDERLASEISALAELGIPTYVIGMPGAEAYDALLSRLAELGGTAKAGETAYFSAADTQGLADALRAIGTGVAISCTIELESEPEAPDKVNLYFDGRLIAADDAEGWRWVAAQAIEVTGSACTELKSGEVLEAQVVYGCDTVVR